jgi:hypothetical protein
VTGAQSRTIARLKKKHPGLEWSTTNGVRVRYPENGEVVEKVVLESGLTEDPPMEIVERQDKREVIQEALRDKHVPLSAASADAILNALHQAGWKVVPR